MAHHEQYPFITIDRKIVEIDLGIYEIIRELKMLGIKTSFSCENSRGRAYILMPLRSARKLEKTIYRQLKKNVFSLESLDLIEKFVNSRFYYRFAIFLRQKNKKRPGSYIKTLFKWEHAVGHNRGYEIERLADTLFGLRATYRWPVEDSPAVLAMLKEASQKKHGL